MHIIAHIEPLTRLKNQDVDLYQILEIHMQQMGHLVAYREQINWSTKINSMVLGDQETLGELKKIAAKNDGVFLLLAKLLKRTVYKQIILHPHNKGIFLPFSFEEPFTIMIEGQEIPIGSSVRLFEELKWLALTISKLDPSSEVVTLWKNYQEVCIKSMETLTPIMLEVKGNNIEKEE